MSGKASPVREPYNGTGHSTCPICGKWRYETRKAALAIRDRDPKRTYRAYKCGGYWHVTTRDAAWIAGFKDRLARAAGGHADDETEGAER